MITRKRALLLIFLAMLGVFISYFITRRQLFDIKTAKIRLKHFRSLIEEISETIIPSTDSPGAKDAKVVDYIINVIDHCIDEKNTSIILNGLDDLQRYSIKNYAKRFEECSSDARTAILKHFNTKGRFSNYYLNKIRQKLLGETFFEQIKWLTVSGYCLSREGASHGLVYDHIPIDYIACTPYLKQQKAWATH